MLLNKCSISKIIFAVLLSTLFISFNANAQQSSSTVNKSVQTEIKSSGAQTGATLQDLKSKLVDEYGVDGFRFIKSNEMQKDVKNVKNQKTLGAKELSSVSGLDEYTIIIILAAIGAIAVILFIFK